MVERAAALKKKLPKGFLADLKQSQKAKEVLRMNKRPSSAISKTVSKRAREQVSSARQAAVQERMKEIISAHKGPDLTSAKFSHSQTDQDSGIYEKPESSTNPVDHFNKTTVHKPQHLNSSEHEKGKDKDISKEISMDCLMETSEAKDTVETTKKLPEGFTKENHANKKPAGKLPNDQMLPNKRIQRPFRKRKRVSHASDIGSGSDSVSYVSSAAEMERLNNQLIACQAKLTHERKRSRALENKNFVLQKTIDGWNHFFETFKSKGQILTADTDHPVLNQLDIAKGNQRKQGISEEIINRPKTTELSKSCSPRVTEWVAASVQYSGGWKIETPVKDMQDKIKPKSPLCRQLFPETNMSPFKVLAKSSEILSRSMRKTDNALDERSPPHCKSPSVSGSIFKSRKMDQISVAQGKPKSPHIISPKKCSASQSKSRKIAPISNELGPGQLTNKELAPTILKAFRNEAPLQENGTGRLHIGNSVWIRKEIWHARFMNSQKLSTVVKDLAEEIWGFRQCAKMSLSGGKSPKFPSAATKPPAPKAQVEAIFGVYRAKMMDQGMTVNSHLDTAIEEGARKYLREKFNDCAKKISKERKAAEKWATQQLNNNENNEL